MSNKFTREGNSEFYDEIIHLAMCGLSMKECGDYYGLDPLDWIEWCEEHPLVENRHNCGKARGIEVAGKQLLQQIKQGKINAIMFYLKTKGGFNEKSLMEIEAKTELVHIPPPPMPIDPVEASKTYARFMQDS